MATLERHGVRIAYERTGATDGTPVALLPAWMNHHQAPLGRAGRAPRRPSPPDPPRRPRQRRLRPPDRPRGLRRPRTGRRRRGRARRHRHRAGGARGQLPRRARRLPHRRAAPRPGRRSRAHRPHDRRRRRRADTAADRDGHVRRRAGRHRRLEPLQPAVLADRLPRLRPLVHRDRARRRGERRTPRRPRCSTAFRSAPRCSLPPSPHGRHR